MRLLHTSDWHLGRALEGRSRQPEQEAFVDEICALADDQQVDLILIAGDIFDTYNPPAWAEQLFCDAVNRLSLGGRRGVVVVAGNHDSPDRLSAVRPLALNQGIYIYGSPLEEVSIPDGSKFKERVKTLGSGPGWLELGLPSCDQHVVLALLPYPSEARLGRLFSDQLNERTIRDAYSQIVGETFAGLATHYKSNTVNLAVGHLFVQGGAATESERPIEIGGACTVAVDHLPATAQYIALGHLHRPQEVKRAAAPTFYSGSPLAYSFSEASHTKAVYIVDVRPSQTPQVTPVPLQAGRPLLRWSCAQGLAEALQRLETLGSQEAWIDLELHTSTFLTNEQTARLRQDFPGLINIRCVLPGTQTAAPIEQLSSLSLPEIFDRFYMQRRNGSVPESELRELFVALATEAALGQEEGGEG